MQRRTFRLGRVLVLAAAALFLGSCGSAGERAGPERPAGPAADVTIRGFHYVQREAGGVAWEIRADRAERYLDRGRIRLHGVRARFRTPSGEWVRVSAEAADYGESEERLELRGHVRVRTDTGYLLEGERLVWERPASLIRSREPVRLVAPLYAVTGADLRYRIDLRTLELGGGVRTVIPPAPRKDRT